MTFIRSTRRPHGVRARARARGRVAVRRRRRSTRRMIPTIVKAGLAADARARGRAAASPTRASRSTPRPFIGALVTQALVGLHARLAHGRCSSTRCRPPARSSTCSPGSRSPRSTTRSTTSHVAIFGRFYELLAVTLLFTTNAYLILVNGWFRSFEVVPGQRARDRRHRQHPHEEPRPVPHRGASRSRARCSAACSSPRSLLGVLSRAAPQLNVFSLAFPLRVVVALIVVGLARPARSRPALGNLVRDAVAPLGGLGAAPMADRRRRREDRETNSKTAKEAREKGQIAQDARARACGSAMLATIVLLQMTVKRGGDRVARRARRAWARAIAHPEPTRRDAVRGRRRDEGGHGSSRPDAHRDDGHRRSSSTSRRSGSSRRQEAEARLLAPEPVQGLQEAWSAPQAWWELAKSVAKTAVLAVVACPIDDRTRSHTLTGGAGGVDVRDRDAYTATTRADDAAQRGDRRPRRSRPLDYTSRSAAVNKQLKMTRQEVREEMKQQEGNPEMKRAVRGRAMAISRNRMIAHGQRGRRRRREPDALRGRAASTTPSEGRAPGGRQGRRA